MLGRYLWEKIFSLFDEHIIYVKNDIQNLYKMVILKYDELVREMFEMANFLPPPISNNCQYHNTAWDIGNKPFKEYGTLRVIKDGLPVVTNNWFEKKECGCHTLPDEYCIDLLGTLETHYDSRRSDHDDQKPSTNNKKKSDWYAGTNSDSKEIPMVPYKKNNPC